MIFPTCKTTIPPFIIHPKILPVSREVKAENTDPFFLKSSGKVHHRNAFLQMTVDHIKSTNIEKNLKEKRITSNVNKFRNVILIPLNSTTFLTTQYTKTKSQL